ncbi:MAG: hypothetical protein Q4D38_10100 [Planctomycetia bacterium]|nr:hypothetical protein [Planctomycetia bacterium]
MCRFWKMGIFIGICAVGLAAGVELRAQTVYQSNEVCQECVGAPQGHAGLRRVADTEGGWQTKGYIADWHGPMPQTNYGSHFGCYPGNARTIHRYPAFHGYYYRSPYNYRHYSEYPWNADMAEPRAYPKQTNFATGTDVGAQAPTPAAPKVRVIEDKPIDDVDLSEFE